MAKSDQEMYAKDPVMRKKSLESTLRGQTEDGGRVNVKGKKAFKKGDLGIRDEGIAYDD